MKKLLLLLIPAVLFGCKNPEDKSVATVADKKITQGEFDFELGRLSKVMIPQDYNMSDEEKEKFEAQVLNSMIIKELYSQKIDELGIEIDEAQVDAQIASIAQQYGSEEALEQDVIAKGFTMDELKEEFKYQLAISELSKVAAESDIEISDESVETYYNENKETTFAQQESVQNARHILITTDDKSQDEALSKINAVKKEITNGLDFSEAAKKYSEGPSGPNGGNLGQFYRGQMVPEFDEAAFTLPLNEVSEPVLTQFGYHLIIVDERTEKGYATLDETRDYISNKLKVEQYFEELESSVKVKKPKWAEIEA